MIHLGGSPGQKSIKIPRFWLTALIVFSLTLVRLLLPPTYTNIRNMVLPDRITYIAGMFILAPLGVAGFVEGVMWGIKGLRRVVKGDLGGTARLCLALSLVWTLLAALLGFINPSPPMGMLLGVWLIPIFILYFLVYLVLWVLAGFRRSAPK